VPGTRRKCGEREGPRRLLPNDMPKMWLDRVRLRLRLAKYGPSSTDHGKAVGVREDPELPFFSRSSRDADPFAILMSVTSLTVFIQG